MILGFGCGRERDRTGLHQRGSPSGLNPPEETQDGTVLKEMEVPRGCKPADPSSSIQQTLWPHREGLFVVSQELAGK